MSLAGAAMLTRTSHSHDPRKRQETPFCAIAEMPDALSPGHRSPTGWAGRGSCSRPRRCTRNGQRHEGPPPAGRAAQVWNVGEASFDCGAAVAELRGGQGAGGLPAGHQADVLDPGQISVWALSPLQSAGHRLLSNTLHSGPVRGLPAGCRRAPPRGLRACPRRSRRLGCRPAVR